MSRVSAARTPTQVGQGYGESVQAQRDAVLIFDVSADHYSRVTTGAERLLGYTRAELLRMSLAELVAPVDLPRLPEVGHQMDVTGFWQGEW